MGLGSMGKLGRAWVGAWHGALVHVMVHGMVHVWGDPRGRLFFVGGCLIEGYLIEGVLKMATYPILTPPNLAVTDLHDTAATCYEKYHEKKKKL